MERNGTKRNEPTRNEIRYAACRQHVTTNHLFLQLHIPFYHALRAKAITTLLSFQVTGEKPCQRQEQQQQQQQCYLLSIPLTARTSTKGKRETKN